MSKESYETPVAEAVRFEPGRALLVEVSPTGSEGENAGDEGEPNY